MRSIGRLFPPSQQCHRRDSQGLAQRAILAGCGALVILGLCSSQASAASPAVSPDPDSAPVGEAVAATGSGWDPSVGDVSIFAEEAEVADPSAALVTATPDADGSFSVALPVPDMPAGTYAFVACQRCDDPYDHLGRWGSVQW